MTDRYDWAEDPTGQDVIDALRVLVTTQRDPAQVDRLVRCLLEFAPESESSRGFDLLGRLLAEGTLRAVVVSDA
jgi:hypothetical protein